MAPLRGAGNLMAVPGVAGATPGYSDGNPPGSDVAMSGVREVSERGTSFRVRGVPSNGKRNIAIA